MPSIARQRPILLTRPIPVIRSIPVTVRTDSQASSDQVDAADAVVDGLDSAGIDGVI